MLEITLNLGADVEEVTTIAMPIAASDWSVLMVIPDMLESQILAGPGTAAEEAAPWLGPHTPRRRALRSHLLCIVDPHHIYVCLARRVRLGTSVSPVRCVVGLGEPHARYSGRSRGSN